MKENNNISIAIGMNIRKQRRLKELSQGKLGEILNMTAQQVYKYEAGINNISVIKLKEISDFFQFDFFDIQELKL